MKHCFFFFFFFKKRKTLCPLSPITILNRKFGGMLTAHTKELSRLQCMAAHVCNDVPIAEIFLKKNSCKAYSLGMNGL